MNTEIDWQALGAPFPPKDVSFRIQTTPKDGQTRALVVAYVDARAVADRLDEICGKEGWSFDWQPILTGTVDGKPAVLAAKGILTIGGVSKSDVGDAGDTEPTKASVSDSLKRAAVLWGIGRYLYDMPRMYAETVKHGRSTYLADGEEARLRREHLTLKPNGQNAHQHTPAANLTAHTKHATPTPSATPAASSAQAQPSTDPMALTHASEIDQKRLYGQLAARWASADAQSGFLRNVTGRAIDADKLRDGRSDISLDELLRANERLTHMPANGKAAAR